MNIERFRYKAWFNFAELWEMIELKGFYFDNLLSGQEIICIMAKDDDCTYEGILGEDCILVACTGFRDSAGRLIWEGDIVIVPDEYTEPILDYGQGPRMPCDHIVPIEYRNGEFGFEIPKDDGGERGWFSWNKWTTEIDNRGIKVLGNIYEHGHLLTQHKSTDKEGG